MIDKKRAVVVPPKGYHITQNPKFIETLVLICSFNNGKLLWKDASLESEPSEACLYIFADKIKKRNKK